MTGCANAIAARDRYIDAARECRLAYGLHLRPGFRCRRQGGDSQCGACASDVLPTEWPKIDERRPLSGVKPISATR